MKSVVVTGSSTGIGWGIAKVLVAKGFRVFGSVRKAEDGERLKEEFGANFMPLTFDVTDAQAVARGAEQVSAALGGETLSGLVNNAGIAVAGPLLYLKLDEFRQQIEVNLTGQLVVTQAFAPLLGADRSRTGAPCEQASKFSHSRSSRFARRLANLDHHARWTVQLRSRHST